MPRLTFHCPSLRRLAAGVLLALLCLHGPPARAQLSIVPTEVASDPGVSVPDGYQSHQLTLPRG